MKEEKYLVDMLGQNVFVSDTVVYSPPYRKGLYLGIVENIKPKTIDIRRKGDATLDNKRALECIKINEQISIAKEKYPENFI